MSLDVGQKLGHFEILSTLGSGGMGDVYRAKDLRLDRTVAIKVLSSTIASNPTRRERLEREAKAISKLSHPNICSLFDVGEQEGIYFLVLEYLEGRTLAERLVAGALPLREALRIGAEVADGVGFAHKHGIVHRDIKPANIIVTSTGAKLVDFGLAWTQTEPAPAGSEAATAVKRLTSEGAAVGTPSYMAPEQIVGDAVDARTDIFALGVFSTKPSRESTPFAVRVPRPSPRRF